MVQILQLRKSALILNRDVTYYFPDQCNTAEKSLEGAMSKDTQENGARCRKDLANRWWNLQVSVQLNEKLIYVTTM